jgi:hypothetical protein
MKRRDVLKAGVAGLAAIAAAKTMTLAGPREGGAPPERLTEKERLAAPPCGLFCEACSEWTKGRCHGCGCDCGKCIGAAHARHCKMYACAKQKRAASCADCAEFACTKAIMHANDPIWRTHASCLENLRRRKVIGTKAWVAEQRKYWADKDNLRKQQFLEAECKQRLQKLKQQGPYKRQW